MVKRCIFCQIYACGNNYVSFLDIVEMLSGSGAPLTDRLLLFSMAATHDFQLIDGLNFFMQCLTSVFNQTPL